METSPLQVKGCKFWPMFGTYWRSAVRFSVPYLLWQVASVYNGHLRGPKTLTPITERSAVEISLPVLITYVYRGGDSNTTSRLRGERSNDRSNRLRHPLALNYEWDIGSILFSHCLIDVVWFEALEGTNRRLG